MDYAVATGSHGAGVGAFVGVIIIAIVEGRTTAIAVAPMPAHLFGVVAFRGIAVARTYLCSNGRETNGTVWMIIPRDTIVFVHASHVGTRIKKHMLTGSHGHQSHCR